MVVAIAIKLVMMVLFTGQAFGINIGFVSVVTIIGSAMVMRSMVVTLIFVYSFIRVPMVAIVFFVLMTVMVAVVPLVSVTIRIVLFTVVIALVAVVVVAFVV